MTPMRFSINIFLVIVFMCTVEMLHAQAVYHSVYDPYHEKKIDLDKLPTDEVFDIAANYHRRRNFNSSDTVYDYLIEKNLFTINPADTERIAAYGTYINLAHLRIVKHKYKEAQTFLQLAGKAEEPTYFCGNAYQAMYAEKETYELVTQLALGHSSTLLTRLINKAFEDPWLEYAGEGLVHYLKYKYGDTEMLKILGRTKYTITANKIREEDYVYAKGQMLDAPFEFRVFLEDEVGDDPAVIKKIVMDYFKLSFDGWRNKY